MLASRSLGTAGFRGSATLWRRVAGALAVLALALAVATMVKRPPPDFADRPVVAVLRDAAGRPVWAVRLAFGAREIGVMTLRSEPLPKGRAYHLWLERPGAGAPTPLGTLPGSGRRTIPLTPRAAWLLSGPGRLTVTIGPAQGAANGRRHSAPLFQATLHADRLAGNLVTEK